MFQNAKKLIFLSFGATINRRRRVNLVKFIDRVKGMEGFFKTIFVAICDSSILFFIKTFPIRSYSFQAFLLHAATLHLSNSSSPLSLTSIEEGRAANRRNKDKSS
jgi:hypothetical protein